MTTTTRWTWDGEPPPLPARVLALAPHPDDEVLGMGGLLVYLNELHLPVWIVAVTDGEASHAQSTLTTPTALRSLRARERKAALTALGVEADTVRLGLPDGGVAGVQSLVVEAVASLADAATVVIAPWRRDGHPDHEATGEAAHRACQIAGARLWEVPIWAKVASGSAGARPPGRSSLVLSPELRQRKREAAACFESQLVGLSDDIVDGPVVHPHELEALLDGREEVLWT